MWIAILNIILSPFGLLFFLICFPGHNSSLYTPTGTNTVKIKTVPYFIYIILYTLLLLGITYFIGNYFFRNFDLWQVYQPRYLWLSVLSWGATALTIRVYHSGMEDNVMGFIFFPLLAISSLGLFIVNISEVFNFYVSIDLPALNPDFFWGGFIIHAFLPFNMLFFCRSLSGQEEKERDKWILPIISSFILQLFLFALHWAFSSLWGNGISFIAFFGKGQSYLYYIPMVGGFLYYLLYLIKPKDKAEPGIIASVITILAILLIFLQVLNYLRLIQTSFNS